MNPKNISYKEFIPKLYGFKIYGKKGSKYYEKVKLEKKLRKDESKIFSEESKSNTNYEIRSVSHNFKSLCFK